MRTRTPMRVLLTFALMLALLPMLSTFAPGGQVAGFTTASPAAADQIWYQSVGRASATAACQASTVTLLAAGWTNWAPSWDTWVNGGNGGFVCNRHITWAFDSVPSSSPGSGPTPISRSCTTTSGGSTPIACAVSTTSTRVFGPGGGQVFYDAGTEQSWGRFMEAATADITTLELWCVNTTTPITGTYGFGTAIGTGKANTDLMVAPGACTSGAANSAHAYGTAGAPAGSWFLPSLDELNRLYTQRTVVGGFAANFWSSSQHGANRAWLQSFDHGGQFNASETNTIRVRPVRAF